MVQVEVREQYIDEQQQLREDIYLLDQTGERADESLLFEIPLHEGGFKRVHLEPIVESGRAYRAFVSTPSITQDTPGSLEKMSGFYTHFYTFHDIVTPDIPSVVHADSESHKYSVHVMQKKAVIVDLASHTDDELSVTA